MFTHIYRPYAFQCPSHVPTLHIWISATSESPSQQVDLSARHICQRDLDASRPLCICLLVTSDCPSHPTARHIGLSVTSGCPSHLSALHIFMPFTSGCPLHLAARHIWPPVYIQLPVTSDWPSHRTAFLWMFQLFLSPRDRRYRLPRLYAFDFLTYSMTVNNLAGEW